MGGATGIYPVYILLDQVQIEVHSARCILSTILRYCYVPFHKQLAYLPRLRLLGA